MQNKMDKKTVVIIFISIILMPFTLYIGSRFFSDRKYYFISLLIIFYTILPFFMIFEKREPMAREIILISVMTAIAVVSRVALYFIPHVKPIIAIIIITAIGFGAEAGFMVGAVSAFVSNFFFGQGPWTPYQMFTFALIGFIAGLVFNFGLIKKTKLCISIFGFFSIILIFGPILNISSAITSQGYINIKLLKMYILSGIPIDLIQASSTFVFLYFLTEPMLVKIERVKKKYGLYEK